MRVVDSAPQNLSAWLMLGETQAATSDWKAAKRSYTMALRVSSASPEAHAGLGVALANLGDKDAARQLDWFKEKTAGCGSACGALGKYKAQVETAIATGGKTG